MTPPRISAADPRLAAFAECWRERNYFEAHEALEAFWLEYRSADRAFYQGLIQAAVALHHATHGNLAGARGVARSCRRRMAPFAPRHEGLDIVPFLEALERAVAGGPPPELP